MMLLDSDHISVLFDLRHSLRPGLTARLDAVDTEIQLPIISVEEHLSLAGRNPSSRRAWRSRSSPTGNLGSFWTLLESVD